MNSISFHFIYMRIIVSMLMPTENRLFIALLRRNVVDDGRKVCVREGEGENVAIAHVHRNDRQQPAYNIGTRLNIIVTIHKPIETIKSLRFSMENASV